MPGTKGRSPFPKTEIQQWKEDYTGVEVGQIHQKHRAVRRFLAPAFNSRVLKEQVPILYRHIDSLLRIIVNHTKTDGIQHVRDSFRSSYALSVQSNAFLTVFHQAGSVGTVHKVSAAGFFFTGWSLILSPTSWLWSCPQFSERTLI
ncbi:hypothetical protein BKA67DRAFT_388097 [Truncatella angustata]|uniref:Uncharacterized protein n=1 Tax=Truncatella angustata TaxID=152316 RepID=A0A9P8UD13_9PEZI|nr:uncharacterized protein BKA67DRAFT_388097 [Truncatella angustata]KAH6647483.1 hypothetical protein BKA67DRAFT_388097 [Truncatella angustata]